MDPEKRDLLPEREQTDDSLRNERAKTDEELGVRLAVIEADTAGVVDRERGEADAMIDAARGRADRKLLGTGKRATPSDAVATRRVLEDQILARERAATDQEMHGKQAENIGMLLRLLPLEREKTDRYLLTEREHADEALANRDDFLGIVSHDLRNLLGTVHLSAQILERDALQEGPHESALREARRIGRAAAHMNRLIGDLVDISSIEAGKLSIAVSPGDAATLITDAVTAFRPTANEKGLSLESEGELAVLPALFDRDRMHQVLANLVGNAIKFTSRGGKIRMGARRVGPDIRLSVRDSGPGIPEAQLEAVFERFWQVGKNDRRGLGLGLYIAKSIVLAHGGRIWAESEPGKGSTLHLTLPAADRTPEASKTATLVRAV